LEVTGAAGGTARLTRVVHVGRRHATLTIESEPENLTVYIDGVERGRTPLTVELDRDLVHVRSGTTGWASGRPTLTCASRPRCEFLWSCAEGGLPRRGGKTAAPAPSPAPGRGGTRHSAKLFSSLM
jgi:PEGA domain.